MPTEIGDLLGCGIDMTQSSGSALHRKPAPTPRPQSFLARAWSAILAAWGVFIGVLPHVLHHVGPLAGAALLAGAGGTALFAAIGIVTAIPFLIRLQRKFRSWRAPAIALAVFIVAFSFSSFVIGPALSGGSENSSPSQPGVEQPSGHYSHHH